MGSETPQQLQQLFGGCNLQRRKTLTMIESPHPGEDQTPGTRTAGHQRASTLPGSPELREDHTQKSHDEILSGESDQYRRQ